ncbi:MAG: hypothetical protein J6M53_00715 [Bacteroidaceae bacterium]|nr:hypothetical protein [Bacteroidaceae bacterium]
MRKITSLLTLLLLFVAGTAVAQISDVSELSNNKQYLLSTVRGSLGVRSDNTLGSSNTAAADPCTASNFAIIQFAGNYYLYSVEAKKYITNSGGEIDDPGIDNTHALSIKKNNDNFVLDFASTGKTININNSTKGIDISDWGTTYVSWGYSSCYDDGNQFTITEVDDFDPTEAMSVFPIVVEVTYELYESDGTTFVTRETVSQEQNSEVSIPASMSSNYYDFVTEGTIGSSAVTIKVTRTLKSGIVYPYTNVSNDKAYTITCGRGSLGTYNGEHLSSTNPSGGDNKVTEAGQFAIISYEGNYYLYSVDASKFVTNLNNGDYSDTPSADYALTFGETTAPLYQISIGSSMYINVNNNLYGLQVVNYTNRDDGNQLYISEAGSFDPTAALAALEEYFHPSYTVTYVVKDTENNTLYTSEPVGTTLGASITTLPDEYKRADFYTYNTIDLTVSETSTTAEFTATLKAQEEWPVIYTEDATSPYYYNLKIRGKYIVRQEDNTVINQTASEPFNPAAAWAFIGNPYDGFRVINQQAGTNYFLMYDEIRIARHGVECTTLRENDTRTWYIETNNNTSYPGGFVLRAAENTEVYLHQRTDNGLSTCSVTEWSAVHNDDGSTIVASTDEDVLQQVYDALKAVPFGDGLNQYTATGKTTSEINTALDEANTALTTKNTSAYAEIYANLLEVGAAITLNMPETGKFYRIKSSAQNAYVSSVTGVEVDPSIADGYKTFFTTSGTSDEAATVWFWTADGKLVNFATGLNSNNFAAAGVGEAGVTFDFQEASNGVGQYWVHTSESKYWYGGVPTLDNYSDVSGTANTLFTLEEVTVLPVEISAAGQRTFSLPVAWEVPAGVTVRYATRAHDNLLTLEDAAVSAVAANEAVVLVGDEGTHDVTLADEGEILGSVLTPTALGGTVVAADVNAYVLAKPAEEVVFALLADDDRAIAGFKAYYVLETTGDAPAYLLIDDELTGIASVNAAAQAGRVVYDLQGRRVSALQKGGVYVVNGKKVLVK